MFLTLAPAPTTRGYILAKESKQKSLQLDACFCKDEIEINTLCVMSNVN